LESQTGDVAGSDSVNCFVFDPGSRDLGLGFSVAEESVAAIANESD
jgi:hypothetical protein